MQVVTTQHTGRSPRPRNARTTRSTPTEDDPFRTELRRGALVHTRESSVRGFWKPARWHAADSTASVAPTPHHTTPVAVPIASIDTQKSAARSSPASLNAAPGTPHAAEPGSRCFPPPGQEHPFHIVRTTCGPYSPVPREAGAHHVHPTVQPLYYCASLRMLCARDSQSPSIRLPAQSTPTRQSLEVRRRRSSPCPQPRPSRYSPVISFSKVRNCHPSPSPSPAQSPSHVSIVSRHLAIPKHTPTPPFARRRQPGLWTALHRRPREPCASVPAATC